MTAGNLSERIRTRARELGFERVGISPARRARRAELFERWLDGGLHGEMAWLARDPRTRSDPAARDPWALSVVSVSMNYLPALEGWDGAPGILGMVARYAAGRDYHALLRERLESLLEFVRLEAPGCRGRVLVDSSPLLEREFAESAGVGWLAKNTMIIDEGLGSWTFLGELVLDRELPYDAPVEDRCGSCRACIDACPTRAIREDRTLDARRCISYLTIELRSAIPSSLRQAVGRNLFGCDVCQEVCPWNRKAPETREPALRADGRLERLSLAEVAGMDEARFRARFAGSALTRARRVGLVRNALIVGANAEDGPTLEAAAAALEDPAPVVRSSAAWALGRVPAAEHARRLEAALRREEDPAVRVEIEAALEGR